MRVHETSIPAPTPYPGLVKKRFPPELDFHERLVALRKERCLTQQVDAIRKLARALSVSADMLLFAQDERGPDDEMKLQFEAASRLDPEKKNVIRSVIESFVLRNTVNAAGRRFSENRGSTR